MKTKYEDNSEVQGLIIRQEQAFWVSGASIINRQ